MNNVVTKYTLHGKNIVHIKTGNDELHFFYDAQNKPAVVVYNGTAYSYVKNLQGDIVALLDSTGAVVVSYVYDAWGKPISKTGSMASTLGTVQPFRYRGYVYDEETGLYYLRSRYYPFQNHRFLNSDGYLFDKNLYSYCGNCPITQQDPDGEATETYLGDGSDGQINTWLPDEMALGGGGTWGTLMRTLQSATKGLNMALGQHSPFSTVPYTESRVYDP